LLSAYNFSICYKKGSEVAYAATLSWLALQTTCTEGNPLCVRAVYKDAPMSFESIKESADLDEEPQKIKGYIKSVCPLSRERRSHVQPYYTVCNELSLVDNCVAKGQRVVIPRTMKADVLDLLHRGHVGIVCTKLLA
jgi:hypothetical protein